MTFEFGFFTKLSSSKYFGCLPLNSTIDTTRETSIELLKITFPKLELGKEEALQVLLFKLKTVALT